MTQAYNLSQLANNLTSSGLLDAADGLVNAVPVANGGTGATSPSAARTNLGLVIGTNVPSPTGSGASGTWNISISGSSTSCSGTANYANSAGTASALASGTSISPAAVYASEWVWANRGGTGGDCATRMYSSGSVGIFEAVNLAGNATRWLRIQPQDLCVFGNITPELYSKVTVDGRIYARESNGGPSNGYVMVNSDGRIGRFTLGNGYIETYLDNVAYGINVFLSDARIKKDIAASQYNATSAVNRIEFVDFEYDEDKSIARGHVSCGVTSQQLETINPEFVQPQGELLNPRIDNLVYLALKNGQEANTRISALEKEVEELRNLVKMLSQDKT